MLKRDFTEYVTSKLPREDDKELFRKLLEVHSVGGPSEVKDAIKELIRDMSGV